MQAAEESTVEWLNSIDQKVSDITKLPFLTTSKVQMQKCAKCSLEFCSSVNYKRHLRLHRRSANFDKESHKYRDLLGAFWDKLSVDEVGGVVSLQDVSLKEIAGSSLVHALSTALSKPGFWNLPRVYASAGSKLLEVIQANPSKLPVTSQELFSILDDASEGTFLCAGTAESVQNYVFDGEAAKIGFDPLNVIACTSFLFEHKLIKAWSADKDAEALRLQKSLFEEEEAAKNKQAELSKKKKLKKLRQKEQKAREQLNKEEINLEVPADKSEVPLPEASRLPAPSRELLHEKEGNLEVPEIPSLPAPSKELSNEKEGNLEVPAESLGVPLPKGNLEVPNAQWQAPKSKRFGRRGSRNNKDRQALKGETIQKQKDSGGPVISNKSSTRKLRVESDETSIAEVPKEAFDQKQINHELMIGSLSFPLKDCSTQSAEGRDDFGSAEPAMPKKSDIVWKPHDAFQKGSVPVRHEGGKQDPEDGVMSSNLDDQI